MNKSNDGDSKIAALEKTVNHLTVRIVSLESKLKESAEMILGLSVLIEQFLNDNSSKSHLDEDKELYHYQESPYDKKQFLN